MNTQKLKLLNAISFGAMVLINLLANVLKFGGVTTGGVSEKYPTLFTPAPITFFIWGVIYLLMGAFVLYQYGLFDKGNESDRVRDRVGILFSVTCILNILWIFSWHYDFILLSTIFIFLLLVGLILIEQRLDGDSLSPLSIISTKLGFDIYFGWIIIASVANLSVLLVKLGWNRFGLPEAFWTVCTLLIGALIGSAAVFVSRNFAAALTIIWAYCGVIIRHLSPEGFHAEYPLIVASAIAGIVVILSSMVIKIWQERVREHCDCEPLDVS